MDGMFGKAADRLADLLGLPRHVPPSELYMKRYPSHAEKTKIRQPAEDFLSAPVMDSERGLLGQVPPEMLYELNKQALDRDLHGLRFWHAVQRAKLKRM